MNLNNKKTINKKTAKEITGGICPQVINIGDLKKAGKVIFVKVNEDESILLQYYLFEHGWRTVSRKFDTSHKYPKLKSIRKNKFKFESIACTSIKIRIDGTFRAPIWDYHVCGRNEIGINFDEIIAILKHGYAEVLE